MNNTKTDGDFLFALDYILNKATMREIEAFAAAVERRQGQLAGAINPTMPFTPDQAAKKMSESIYASIDASMDGVRHTFRDYAADLLQKEAPELSKEQIIGLVDSYSLGEMPVETQRSLTAAMHNWTESYWRRFPTGIKQEIKVFLNGEITSGEFQGHLREMLGLV